MERRNFISTAGAFVATAALGKFTQAFADEGHHKHFNSASMSLAVAASECVVKGQACLQHCMTLLSSGDTSMAGCAKSVREMMVYCDALSKAAAQDSKHLKQLAKIAMDTCKDCEAECRKHADKHQVCKECAESCAECYQQCKSIAA